MTPIEGRARKRCVKLFETYALSGPPYAPVIFGGPHRECGDPPIVLVGGTPLHFLAEENCSARPSSMRNTVSTPKPARNASAGAPSALAELTMTCSEGFGRDIAETLAHADHMVFARPEMAAQARTRCDDRM